MEELALCLEYILLNRDRIFVPGLGSFVVKQLEAHYDSKEETFLPPMRIVQYEGLTQKSEDAFLLLSLQKIFNIDQQTAQAKMDMWLADFYRAMEDCGSVDIGCIGTFTQGENGTLLFSSSESGIVSPSFYALDIFHVKELKAQPKSEETSNKVISNTDHAIVIRLPHRIMKYVAAASVAFIMVLGLSIPVQNSTRTQISSQLQSSLFVPGNLSAFVQTPSKATVAENAPATTETAPTVKAGKKETVTGKAETVQASSQETVANTSGTVVANAKQEPGQEAPKTEAKPQGKTEQHAEPAKELVDNYCIVLASAISDKNAANYVEVLKQRGFVSARVLQGGKFNRVVVGRYATEGEARVAVSSIQKKDKEYSGAWIFKNPGK